MKERESKYFEILEKSFENQVKNSKEHNDLTKDLIKILEVDAIDSKTAHSDVKKAHEVQLDKLEKLREMFYNMEKALITLKVEDIK